MKTFNKDQDIFNQFEKNCQDRIIQFLQSKADALPFITFENKQELIWLDDLEFLFAVRTNLLCNWDRQLES